MRKLAILAATSVAAMAVPSAANAQSFTFDSVGDSTGALNFDDFFNTGMSAQLTLTLTGLNTSTGLYTFSYSLLNNSDAVNNPNGRVSSFGFNDNQGSNPSGTILTGSFDTIDTDGANYPNGIGDINICLFDGPGQCTGNGNGPTPGQSISGSFSLDYPGSLSSLTLSDFSVRYQSTFQGGSSTGQVTNVPEPATWAMMLVGFGATGVAMRRRRRKVAFAQFA